MKYIKCTMIASDVVGSDRFKNISFLSISSVSVLVLLDIPYMYAKRKTLKMLEKSKCH